ncbi:MAG TPA: DUF948 domain-containing protein [Candidatus Gracilibacteria bacterium]|nr:hypothetical protein [Candidatus Gracilibacteria bacterium]HRY91611.1 DUF948 domain-containing protein [Candidatus Gracilibacteria bacterium]
MDALTFLYWSLGVGFAVLILFLCIAIAYLIKILRDVSRTTHTVTDIVEKVNENVAKITDKVTDVTEQIAEYVVKPVSVIQFLMEKIRPVIDMIQRKGEELGNIVEQEEETRPRKKGVGRRK